MRWSGPVPSQVHRQSDGEMTDIERFMAKVIPEPNSGCWLWVGGVTGTGYGQFWDSSRKVKVIASRWAYEQFKGYIPDGIFSCHHCDVRSCVNPSHLFLGTQSDNMTDCSKKNRIFRWASNDHLKKYGTIPVPWQRGITHCKAGHGFTPENTYKHDGKRKCRACRAEASRRYEESHRNARAKDRHARSEYLGGTNE